MRAVKTNIVTVFVATLTAATFYRAEARTQAEPEVRAESRAAQAEHHLREACELVWAGAAPYKIDQCTKRTMGAMGDENRLRDNELKRMLIASEQELQTCTQALAGVRRGRAAVAEVRGEKPNR